MGSELFKQYQIDKTKFISGGYLNLWKIYTGYHKQRKNKVCVFVLEKSALNAYSSKEQDNILSVIKKEATSLVKYKHPNILSVIEPLIEDKYSFGFVTEYFSNSLLAWSQGNNLSKIEIKMIITDLCKTLNFLHNDCNEIHLNINPENIFFNKDECKIKLSGFNFSTEKNEIKNFHLNNSPFMNPCLSYSSPEMIYENTISYKNDIFSIGVLIYNLLMESSSDLINILQNIPENYRKAYNEKEMIQKIEKNKKLEDEDKQIIKALIEKDPKKRPDTIKLLEFEWFTDYKLKSLIFIENLATNDIQQNTQFLKEFPSLLGLFEHKILLNKFLPCLLTNLKNEALLNLILPVIFSICHLNIKSLNFSQVVWPYLIEIISLKTIPAASLYYLLTKIPYIGANISQSDFSNHCLDIICKALDCGVAKIQKAVLNNIVFISQKVEAKIFQEKIYPRLLQIMLSSKDLKLKVQIIFAFSKVISSIDKEVINTSLLDNITKVINTNKDFKICYAVCDILEEIEEHFEIECITKKIIPLLLVILTKGTITNELCVIVNKLIDKFLKKVRLDRTYYFDDHNETEKEETNEIKHFKEDPITIEMDATNKEKIKQGNDFLKSFFKKNKKREEIVEENNENNEHSNNNNEKEGPSLIPTKKINITKAHPKKEEEKQDFIFNELINKNTKEDEQKSTSMTLEKKKIKRGWDDDMEDNEDEHTNKDNNTIKEESKQIQGSKPKIQKLSQTEKANLDSLLDD